MNAEAELIALRSMCRAAAAEIQKHYDAHCDAEGYGPCILMARLTGRQGPALYPNHATHEECVLFFEGIHVNAQKRTQEATVCSTRFLGECKLLAQRWRSQAAKFEHRNKPGYVFNPFAAGWLRGCAADVEYQINAERRRRNKVSHG